MNHYNINYVVQENRLSRAQPQSSKKRILLLPTKENIDHIIGNPIKMVKTIYIHICKQRAF